MITITITHSDSNEAFRQSYVLVGTTAPSEYDYAYCIEAVSYLDRGDRRYVLIPEGSAEYQMGRYRSGLYSAERVTHLGDYERGLIGRLAERLTAPLTRREERV